MHCLILNGSPAPTSLDTYLRRLGGSLEQRGHSTRHIDLRDLELRTCIGCWSCWWKTPGLCALEDDMSGLYPEMVRADVVVWSSPLIMGSVSALLKTVQDRFIPLVHPYIELVDGECHHRHRYAHNADLAVIVAPTDEDTDEDLAINRWFWERFSRNSRTRLRLFGTTATPIEEAVDATLAA